MLFLIRLRNFYLFLTQLLLLNSKPIATLKSWSYLASVAVILLGSFVLLGWAFNITIFKSVFSGLVTMKANTALGFILNGCALLLYHQAKNELNLFRILILSIQRIRLSLGWNSKHQKSSVPIKQSRIFSDSSQSSPETVLFFSQVVAIFASLIGILTVIQYSFDLDLGIDQILFKEDINPVGTYSPGRMAINTAISFILQGTALFLLSRRLYYATQFLSLTSFLIAFMGLLGYLYKIDSFYGLGVYSQMALHTAITFIILAVGILFACPERGFMKTATSELAGGVMLRRLLLAILIMPPSLGWLVLMGKRTNLYNEEVAVALLSILNIIVLAIVIWWNATTLGKVDYQALHDPLTGLPNRILFNKRLEIALNNTRKNQGVLAVMFLDLDRFKKINDSLGHNLGDELIKAVVARLSYHLHPEDLIARWGGDEFTLLLAKVRGTEHCAQIAQSILEVIKPPFLIGKNLLHITSSIGIAIYPGDGNDPHTLVKNADVALYSAKEKGRNNYQFYSPAINNEASELLVIENRLHHALERGEFSLYYQPKVNIKSAKITGVEALIRWQSPTLGVVSPNKFISLAEENGLIIPIGEWVLKTACQQVQDWMQSGLPKLKISVNLSVRQFHQQNLIQSVVKVLEETGLNTRYLELEITETIAMQNREVTKEILHELEAMGVSIAMDDFGTGYSSLSYLKNFPLHTLKIDRSFVRDLTVDPCDVAIASTVVALGHGLRMIVVAEGVETQEQLDCLRSLGCDEIQGYLFSRPIPADCMTELLKKYQSSRVEIVS